MRCGNSEIIVSDSKLLDLSDYLDNKSTIVLLFDENTFEHCGKLFFSSFPELKDAFKYVIKPGEENKTIDTCLDIWNDLINNNILKNAMIICIGGGVVSDLGGFVASIYKRGLDYVFIPTTLLAQVDASIGGKNGVDFNSAKNQLGVISFPKLIYVNPIFLNTLSKKEIISGFAEIVKYALIWDKDFWNMLLTIESINEVNWYPIIKRSIRIKSEIVNKDPYEKSIRKSLNFGHTIGHAIESLFLKNGKPITHGEAIAVGMECELYISSHYFNWDIEKLKNIVNYLRKTFSDIKFDYSDIDELLFFMRNDKKNRGDGINFTMIEDIGEVIVDKVVPENIIRQSIELYLSIRSNDKLTIK